MDTFLEKFYREYGEYVNSFRAFPLDIDGLKPVERRILLTSYEVARDKFVKSAKIQGGVTGAYHPHGEVYGTIVQLHHQGFLDGQGNLGSYVGVEGCAPAAMRYTECKLERNTFNLAFELIDYVDRLESEMDPEPPFLPTMFPFCIMDVTLTDYLKLPNAEKKKVIFELLNEVKKVNGTFISIWHDRTFSNWSNYEGLRELYIELVSKH